MRIFCGLAVFLLAFGCQGEQHRVWIEAAVNHQPVHLVLDTGASDGMLFANAAKRLNLKFTNAFPNSVPSPGTIPLQATESCKLEMLGQELEAAFAIVDDPPDGDYGCDGVIGWTWVNKGIFEIDGRWGKFKPLDGVPTEALGWSVFPFRTNSDVLTLETKGPDGKTVLITVDTGAFDGIGLNAREWHEWRAGHSNQPVTLGTSIKPACGALVSESGWAGEFSLGALELRAVPIRQAHPCEVAIDGKPESAAILGLAALRGLDFIVDGPKQVVYLRPSKEAAPPYVYDYNRLGAVFMPKNGQSDDLVATLLEATPAYEAGIRNGDVLLKIDALDVTKSRTDATILPLSRFWIRPAGTEILLTLRRGKDTVKAPVKLRDIVLPKKGVKP